MKISCDHAAINACRALRAQREDRTITFEKEKVMLVSPAACPSLFTLCIAMRKRCVLGEPPPLVFNFPTEGVPRVQSKVPAFPPPPQLPQRSSAPPFHHLKAAASPRPIP